MASTHTSLDAAATDRKARLAKLASLKRKQPGSDVTINTPVTGDDVVAEPVSKTDVYLSGRNYDASSKAPRLGFENAPGADVETVEQRADRIAAETAAQAARDELEAEKGLDLFKLQPKKPNWDLKRDLAEKMKVVDVRTQNAIARLVRERIENAKKEALNNKGVNSESSRDGQTEGEELGIEGNELVEGVHLREKVEAEEEARERELEREEDPNP